MLREIFRRSFTKYLLSYIFCLVLPVFVFSLLYTTIFIRAYSEQLIERTAGSIKNTFESLDLQIDNFNRISQQILSSKSFYSAFFEENHPIVTYFSIGDILNNYIYTNESIFDIWCFDRRRRYFFSPKNMFSQDSFMTYGPGYPGTDLRELLSGPAAQTWIPESKVDIYGQVQPLVTHITAYPYAEQYANAVLMLQIKGAFFEHFFKSLIQYEQSTSEIIDREGRIIYSLDPSLRPVVESIIGSKDFPGTGAEMKSFEGARYFTYTVPSKTGGLSYLSVIPYRRLTGEMNKFSMMFFLVFLLIMACGSVLIFFFMKYNYKPIINLARYSKKFTGVFIERNREMNDIDIIRNVMENIAGKNEEYLREHLFFELFKGRTVGVDKLEASKIDCRGTYNRAVIFRAGNMNNAGYPDNYRGLLEKTLKEFFHRCRVYLLEYLEQNSFIGVFTSLEKHPEFEKTIGAACAFIEESAGLETMAAIGNPCRHITGISLSYTQARTVLRFQINRGTEKTLCFSDISAEEMPNYLFIKAELNTLQEAVSSKNSVKTAFIISELVEIIRNKKASYFFAVCLYYDIINTFIKECYEMNSSTMEIIKKYQILFLGNFDHPIEDLVNIIVSLSGEIMRAAGEKGGLNSLVSHENILKYIESHYREKDFCVQTAADHFGLSFSNLSHQFKTATGKNISSHISALKLSYAKELLVTTKLPVSEIAAMLGYFQASSFIRKFRQAEGVTPRVYRARQTEGRALKAGAAAAFTPPPRLN